MTQTKQIYKCNDCDNIVEVLHEGAGELVCCDQPMQLMEENTVDAANEKHIPVIKQEDSKTTVIVGEIEHPMIEKHFIEWIELISDGKSYRKMLKPGEESKAEFQIVGENLKARAYCNLHGLWSSQ